MPRVSQEHLDARRRQILDGALECFARQGFHRTTMQDIVAASGLSAGALYCYFESKEDIVGAIAEERHAEEAAALARADASGDVVEALHQLVHVSLGRLDDADERRWRRVTVQLWAEALRDERIMAVARSGLDEPLALLADIFRLAQRSGQIEPKFDPEALARVCVAIFQGLVLQQAWDPALDVTAYIDTVLGIIDAVTG